MQPPPSLPRFFMPRLKLATFNINNLASAEVQTVDLVRA
jgi:hypothetical protein